MLGTTLARLPFMDSPVFRARPSQPVSAVAIFALFGLPTAATAGRLAQVGAELSVGAGATAIAVAPGDRVAVTAIGPSRDSIAWIDSIDHGLAAQTYALGATVEVMLGVELPGGGSVLAAGDQLDVLSFDTDVVPAVVSLATPIGLGTGGGRIVDLVWDEDRLTAWGVDAGQGAIRQFLLDGSGSGVDFDDDFPLSLGFEPAAAALLDGDTLLVAGQSSGNPALALVRLDADGGPTVEPLPTPLTTAGDPVAVAADGDGLGFVLLQGGDLWQVLEPEDDGDDDDSVPGDDDSAGDDDSSGDDDSATGARGTDTEYVVETFLGLGLPTPATDLLYVEDEDGDLLIAAGSNLVRTLSVDGADLGSLALTGTVGHVATSSDVDGRAYVAEPLTGLVGVLLAGPSVTIDAVDGDPVPSDDDDLRLTVTVDLGDSPHATCEWSVLVDGGIDGSGTAVDALTGTANDTVPFEITVPGSAIPSGNHRIHVRCLDPDEDIGRASTTVYKGTLVAPGNVTATAADSRVVLRFTALDDASVEQYVIWWSSGTFTATQEPTRTNGDGTVASPTYLDAPATAGDDDSAGTENTGMSLAVTALENGTTYSFAVAAIDDDGNEGPRSALVSATPGVTGGAAALAGDPGGCTCSTATTALAPWAALLLLPILRRPRRRDRGAR